MRLISISSRVAALGLLMLFILIIGVVVGRPLWDRYSSNRDVIVELESQLSRFESISDRQPLLEKELAALKIQVQQSNLMINAKSATLASASLQERVKIVVGESGGTLASTQVLPGKASSGLQRVSVNARMTGSVAEIQSTLYGLESNTPALVIDDLLIVTRRLPSRLRGKDLAETQDLDVRFQVTGFYDARVGTN